MFSAKIGRINPICTHFECPTSDKRLQTKLTHQLKTHFFRHELNVEKLREFIKNNNILESIPADNSDINQSSLRQHLLLTEQIFGLLLQLPQPKNLNNWIETKKVQKFIRENLKPIKEISCAPVHVKIKLNQSLRNVLEFALENKWNEKRIALEMGLSTKQIKHLISQLQ